MSNPRLIAEDIAHHYEEKHNEHFPHAKNIQRYLRKPVLAITRRILLPRMNYDDIDDTILHSTCIGNEPFGAANTHVDPTLVKGREGLDWRDYLEAPSMASASASSHKSISADTDTDIDIESDLSFSETETETEDEASNHANKARIVSSTGSTNDGDIPAQQSMKMNRRSLARMEAFLASCAYALPNDAVSAVRKRGNRIQDPIELGPKLKSIASALPYRFGMKKLVIANKAYATGTGTGTGTAGGGGANAETSMAAALAGFNDVKIASPSRKAKSGKTNLSYPQMHMNDLTLRLTLYIRTLRRVHANLHPKEEQGKGQGQEQQGMDSSSDKPDECVIHLEPQRALKTRIKLVINSLISTVGSVGSMHHILTNLLVHFTREMLAVESISDDLQSCIRKIVLEYEHLTSFASLAFLSTPEDSADTQLAPLLSNYVEYLQKESVWHK
jgi:hypothetical protein